MVYSYSFSHRLSAAVGAACCCRPDVALPSSSSTFKEGFDVDPNVTSHRSLLIFVNPRSGSGRSAQVFSKEVVPKLAASNIHYDIVLTERQNHARSYIASLKDFNLYNAIIIVSGDGLVFEVLNALLERHDAPCIPIGIIPSGSGNGLLSSVFYHRGYSLKKNEFLNRAVNNICNLNAMAYSVNLMHVETPTKSYAASISVGFGLFADIDIESEKWRKSLESARFTAGALVRFANLRTYRCKLSYCLSKEDDYSRTAFPEVFQLYPECSTSDDPSTQTKQPSFSDEIESNNTNLCNYLRQSYLRKGIPKISEPVPSDWTMIEDEFIFIYALTVSHVGQDVPFTPEAKLCDTSIYLSYALKRDLRNRLDLFNFLTDIKYAKHLNYSFLKVVPVTSFRLEKTETPVVGGFVTVDGEVVDCNLLQATNTYSTVPIVAV